MQFRPAVKEHCYTLVGLGGPSGSGKTYSALRLAQGLAQGGKIAMIDTEGRRGLHYADQFDYLYSALQAPFTPDRYREALVSAVKAGAKVIIVDSMSHEHEGPGGILEWHERELDRMAGDDFAKRDQCTWAAWIKPKRAHNLFVNAVLQVEAHLIFCFRAKEKLKLVKNEKGKMQPMPMGWQPICSERFEYEMTTLLILPPNSGGKPDLKEPATKLQDQHRDIFGSGSEIDETMGAALSAWAGDNKGQAEKPVDGRDYLAEAREAAEHGRDSVDSYWKSLTKAERAIVLPIMDQLKKTALAADGDGAAA